MDLSDSGWNGGNLVGIWWEWGWSLSKIWMGSHWNDILTKFPPFLPFHPESTWIQAESVGEGKVLWTSVFRCRFTGNGPNLNRTRLQPVYLMANLKSNIICINPVCKAANRVGHTIDNCFWPGGGKEGQWPEWWFKSRGMIKYPCWFIHFYCKHKPCFRWKPLCTLAWRVFIFLFIFLCYWLLDWGGVLRGQSCL